MNFFLAKWTKNGTISFSSINVFSLHHQWSKLSTLVVIFGAFQLIIRNCASETKYNSVAQLSRENSKTKTENWNTHKKLRIETRVTHSTHTLCQFSFRAVHFHLYIICIPNWAAHKCKMEWINITESNWASAWLIMSFKWNHSVKLAIVSLHFSCLLSHLWFLWWMTDLFLWVSAHLFSQIKLNLLHAFEWKNDFSYLYVRMGFFC